MAFHDVRFPEDIAYGAVGGPAFSTDVVAVKSGREKRNINWSRARRRWDVAHGVKTQAQLDALVAFFLNRGGRAHSFPFKDWTDFRLPRQVIGLGDGAATAFQLVKTYTDAGGHGHDRPITKPVVASVRVWLNGAEQTGGWSVARLTGLVTFDAPPPADAVVEAEGEFDVPVRFDTDEMRVSIDAYDAYSWGQIPLVEVRDE